jgi:acyl-CoA synthetase (AMP-forming)/AMP-acid ligase II
VDLENAAMNHPQVALAAVIGVSHPKWEERPLLLVKLKPEADLDDVKLKEFLSTEVAKWWIPEDIKFVQEIPLTATGKINKVSLRNEYIAEYEADS